MAELSREMMDLFNEDVIDDLVRERFPAFSNDVAKVADNEARRQNLPIFASAVVEKVRSSFPLRLVKMWPCATVLDTVVSELVSEFGAADKNTRTRETWRRFLREAASYRAELGALSKSEQLNRWWRIDEGESNAAEIFVVEDDNDWSAHQSLPDFETWANLALWSIEEATILSLGIEPKSFKEYVREHGTTNRFYDIYRDRLNMIARAHQSGDLKDPLRPVKFAEWADTQMFKTPDLLINLIKIGKIDPYKSDKLDDDKLGDMPESEKSLEGVHSRTRNNWYRLVLGMAITGFKHSTRLKQGTSKTIEGKLESVDLYVGRGTIHKYLSEAAIALDYDDRAQKPETIRGSPSTLE